MKKLEAINDQLNPNIHKDFRLWLTSAATPNFSISILQNSVKMVLQPPKGLKSNLLNTYERLDTKMLNDCKNPDAYKKLIFSLAFFHAVV